MTKLTLTPDQEQEADEIMRSISPNWSYVKVDTLRGFARELVALRAVADETALAVRATQNKMCYYCKETICDCHRAHITAALRAAGRTE